MKLTLYQTIGATAVWRDDGYIETTFDEPVTVRNGDSLLLDVVAKDGTALATCVLVRMVDLPEPSELLPPD